jgi:hypothetical protein
MPDFEDAMKCTTLAVAAAAWLISATGADAAVARYHYVPNGPNRAMTFTPSAPDAGERLSIFGRAPDPTPPRPTVMMTYYHPSSGQVVAVPLALPPGTPQVYHRSNRIVYDFSGYTVQVQFLPDGSVDVIYNSGFLRGL